MRISENGVYGLSKARIHRITLVAGSRSLTRRIDVIPDTPAAQGVEGSYVRLKRLCGLRVNSRFLTSLFVPTARQRRGQP